MQRRGQKVREGGCWVVLQEDIVINLNLKFHTGSSKATGNEKRKKKDHDKKNHREEEEIS
jgi:hypothetical protein